ncbi:MAG: hypothetical protein AABW89_05755 [Nanoarchaeota archaeon]
MNQKSLDIKLRLSSESPTALIINRIASCRKQGTEIIDFPCIFSKLSTSLQLTKEKVWNLLFFLHDMGLIKVINGHGIRVLWRAENE